MADQDTPWKGLPPAPPGVPDQSPKTAPSGTSGGSGADPWTRPEGWRPPVPRGSGPGGGSPGRGSSAGRKIALALGAFVLLNVCVRSVTNVFPDLDDGGERSTVVPVIDPLAPPEAVERSRLVRDGSAGGGWFRYVAGDGSFALVGPGRPEQRVSPHGGEYTFRAGGVALVAEVVSARGLGGVTGRARLERAMAFFLDDLGAIEQARRWSGHGNDVELDVDARRGDEGFRVRSFADGRRVFRAYARWDGALSPDDEAVVERFLGGLEAKGRQ